MATATVAQVKDWMGSQYPPSTTDVQVEMWLNDLENRIKRRIAGFDTKMLDPTYVVLLRGIEIQAAERKLKNPEGYASESVDNVALSYRSDAASGTLKLTEDEWAQLGYIEELGSVRITPDAPTTADYWPGFLGCGEPGWEPASWPY